MSVARHTTYNIVGSIVPVLVSLITIPIYLKAIGLDRYGVLSLCLLLVGYFNLFDFGLGQATAQKMAMLHDASAEQRSSIFWTGLAMSAGLAAFASAIFVPLATFGLDFIGMNADLRHEVRAASVLLDMTLAFGILQSVLVGSLGGRREFLRVNAILSSGTILTAILPLFVAFRFSPTLVHLLAATLLSRAIVIGLLFWSCFQTVPLHRPRLTSYLEVRGMLRFGGWTTLTGIVGPILVYADRFAIGAVLSAAAVAHYTIPFSLVSQLSLLPIALASALMPRLAASSEQEAALLGVKAVQAIAFLVTPLTLIALVASGPFLTLWIGQTAAPSIPVVYILLFGFWANSLAQIPFVRLQARGRPDLLAKLHLVEIIPYLLILYASMRLFGLPGAALAWSIRSTFDAIALFNLGRPMPKYFSTLSFHAALVASAIAVVLFSQGTMRILLSLGLAGLAATQLFRDIPPDIKILAERSFSRFLTHFRSSRGNTK